LGEGADVSARIVVEHRGDEHTFADGVVTFGGRFGVDVVLEDAMVADRHCAISFDDGFRVRDFGSVTGTWIDGNRVIASTDVTDGATIVVGSTRLACSFDDDGKTRVLKVAVDPQSFWWKRPGKGVFDNDPDALVRSEVSFGKFPALHTSNRVAMIVAGVLFVAAVLVSAVMEPLADAGRLMPPHALVTSASAATANVAHAGFAQCAKLADEQGCDVCHAGGGTPEAQCRQCHGVPGEMAGEGSWRHPYHGDGVLGDVPGMPVGQQFCVVCHTDHRGENTFKDASAALVGDCGACHGDGDNPFDEAAKQSLIARAPIALPDPEPRAYATYLFPHDAHLAKKIDCAICHQVDPMVTSDRERGVPDDPLRHDFAEVPYEVCASCHVDDAPAVQMTAAQQAEWRAKEPEHRWALRWHDTDDGGAHCKACHTETQRGDRAVFGPELRTVARGAFSLVQYQAERARYDAKARLHEDQFRAHSQGQACSRCHVDGRITPPAKPPARMFWHGLHMRNGQRRILHITGLFTKDCTEQLFFRRQLGFTFRSHLSNQNVTRLHFSSDTDNATLVQIPRCLFTDIGNIPSHIFFA
jgi:hypothetical protein